MTSSNRVLDLSACRLVVILNGSAGKRDAHMREESIRERLSPRVREYVAVVVSEGGGIAGAARQAAQDWGRRRGGA